MSESSLSSGFLRSSERNPKRTALEVDGGAYTYEELRRRASCLAATMQSRDLSPGAGITAVLAHRSISAFAGILGALMRGHGYAPLNPFHPHDRTAEMLRRSEARTIVVGREALESLAGILPVLDRRMLILLPGSQTVPDIAREYSQHEFVVDAEFLSPDEWTLQEPEESDVAYLLFTSGSTGTPKGVQVLHRNIRHFIDVMSARYSVTAEDRFSQMFELVFDLSLFDMFVAWENGACVCCPSKGDARLPAKFIIDSKITIWFSVPSLAVAMRTMRMLQSGLYPHLRVSLFCGEALPADVASGWSEAAPNSIVENLYGPTEVTLACTLYRWEAEKSRAECSRGLVPIGYPYPGMEAIVVDENLQEVSDNGQGELLMSGPQVAAGYLNDPEKTAAAFVQIPGLQNRYYRTGDRVQLRKSDGLLTYLGRVDHQVKVRGNRVELGEVEAAARRISNIDIVVAVGWPRTASGVDGIVVFAQAEESEINGLKQKMAGELPDYMAPRQVRAIAEMPLNSNGKVDRGRLLEILENDV